MANAYSRYKRKVMKQKMNELHAEKAVAVFRKEVAEMTDEQITEMFVGLMEELKENDGEVNGTTIANLIDRVKEDSAEEEADNE